MRTLPIVTISREFGAGGSSVARLLADELGVTIIDESLVVEVAQRLGVLERTVATADERPEPHLDRLLATLSYLAPASVVGLMAPRTGAVPVSSRTAIASLTQEVIREVGRQGNAVVVGRGGAFILRDHPNARHVFLRASEESRIEAVMRRSVVSATAARQRIRETDAARGAYIKQLYEADWRDPVNYHLVIDTGRLGLAGTADVILASLGAAR